MMEDEKLLNKILSAKGALQAFVADEETFNQVCSLEDGVIDTSFGMPIENRALEACKGCQKRLVLFCTIAFEPPDCHVMTMEDVNGKLVGFDVPDCMREKYSSDPDLIWMGEDFAISPDADIGECTMVMLPQELKCLGEEEGVKRAVLLYPALDADVYLKKKYGVDLEDPRIASAIVGCEPL
ncbi:MAG: hypothetical protein IKH39_09160 [Candidatus Methanomethylophilaceae archaeon]|jgi:hypothetical protein|nr:hypothetical protein [Candidatus Methanomethylophilaceae archaeon]MBR4181865.1 hypothetical protein [Candidatus Methanomethylophilaceae archaeon]